MMRRDPSAPPNEYTGMQHFTANSMLGPTRLLFFVPALCLVAAAYVVVSGWTAPAEPPAVPPARGSVTFDPSADLSRNPSFNALRPLAPAGIDVGTTGRLNPFAPVERASTSTAAASFPSATGTASIPAATGTVPALPVTTSAADLP